MEEQGEFLFDYFRKDLHMTQQENLTVQELQMQLDQYNKMLFHLIKDQTEIRDRLEKEIERLSIENDAKQQKIDYYEGTYFTIEAAAKERMEIIQKQQQEIEKYRKESIFRPLRRVKSLLGRGDV